MKKNSNKLFRFSVAACMAAGLALAGGTGAVAKTALLSVPAPEVTNVHAYNYDWLGVAIGMPAPYNTLDYCYYWEAFYYDTVSEQLEEFSSEGTCEYPYFSNYMYITVAGLDFDPLTGYGAIRLQAADYYTQEPVSPWSTWAPINDSVVPIPEITLVSAYNYNWLGVAVDMIYPTAFLDYCYQWESWFYDEVSSQLEVLSSDGDCEYPYFGNYIYINGAGPTSWDGYGAIRLQAADPWTKEPVAPWTEWATYEVP